MRSIYRQLPALVLGTLASASVITTTFWNQWSVSGPTSKGVLGPIWAWRSLFGECMQYQGGQSQCQGQNSMFLMAGFKLAIRGFMITAIILSTLSCFGILLGSECTRVLEERRGIKRKIMLGCGVGFLLSGIFTFVSVVWYTVSVYQDFFKLESQDNFIHWELGACVYLGFIASFICVLAFLACICRPGPRIDDGKRKHRSYYYRSRSFDSRSSRSDDSTKSLIASYRSRRSDRKSRSSSRRRSCSKSDPPSYKKHASRDSRRKSSKGSSRNKEREGVGSSTTEDTHLFSEYV